MLMSIIEKKSGIISITYAMKKERNGKMAVRNAEDRRVRKTKRQLRTALTTLLLDKELSHITVRDVAELADVNRGTFYAHYKDVAELLHQLENELFSELTALGERYHNKFSNQEALSYLTELFTLAGENSDMVYALHATTVDMAFQHRLYLELKQQYLLPFLTQIATHGANEEMITAFVATGLVSIALNWIEGGKKETPAQLATLFGTIVNRGLSGFTNGI